MNQRMQNPGIPFDERLLVQQSFSSESVLQKINQLTPTAVSKSVLQNIIQCLDLTSLNANDTSETIQILLQKALQPLAGTDLKVAAVCVYQPFVQQAVKTLEGSGIGIATVAGGFPSGQMDLKIKCADIEQSLLLGATEIDAVIRRSLPLSADFKGLYDEVASFKLHCGKAKLKVILATGELVDPGLIFKTSWVCMMAGADTIKTSTGMEKTNATLEAGYVMMQAIQQFYLQTGYKVGIKPAGGIRTLEQALLWMQLLRGTLGSGWENKDYFRIGASALLDDILGHLNEYNRDNS